MLTVGCNRTRLNGLQRWAFLGGHADGNRDLAAVAAKEVNEESGLKEIKFLMPEPIDICIFAVAGHWKNKGYVPAHQHFGVCFVFEADEKQKIRIKETENSKIKWIAFDEIDKYCQDEKDIHMYNRIINKIKRIA